MTSRRGDTSGESSIIIGSRRIIVSATDSARRATERVQTERAVFVDLTRDLGRRPTPSVSRVNVDNASS
jgi:hypothetical protein